VKKLRFTVYLFIVIALLLSVVFQYSPEKFSGIGFFGFHVSFGEFYGRIILLGREKFFLLMPIWMHFLCKTFAKLLHS
jgi:hypothetical protein